MRQQPVVPHSNAQAQRNPIEDKGAKEGRPVEKPKGGDSPNMKYAESDRRNPIDAIAFHQRRIDSIHHVLHGPFETRVEGGDAIAAPGDLSYLPAIAIAPLAAAALAAESATTAATLFFRAGFVDVKSTAVELPAIQRRNGTVRLGVYTHFNESESSGTAGFPVGYDAHAVHRPVFFEQGTNRIFGSPEAEISYKYIFHFDSLSEICRAANRGQARQKRLRPDYTSDA